MARGGVLQAVDVQDNCLQFFRDRGATPLIMSDDILSRRLALLVDAENMRPEYMRQVLPHVFKLGRPVIQYAYGDFSNPASKPWTEFLRSNIIAARQVTPAASGKNAADIALVVDAMEFALRGKCDGVCIVSSDRDFVALTLFLRGEGIAAYGFGRPTTDKKYRQSCDKFFEVKDDVVAPKVVPSPVQPHESAAAAGGAVPMAGPNFPVILQEVARLASNKGWVSLQTLGCVLGKRGIHAKDNGGANWGQVLGKMAGVEIRKDEAGRRSVRFVAQNLAASKAA